MAVSTMNAFADTASAFNFGRGTVGSLGLGFLVLWISLAYWRSETRKLSHIPTVGTTFPIVSYLGTIKYLFDAKTIVDEGIRKWPGRMFKISEMVQWRVIVTDPRVAEEVIRASESIMSGHIANDEFIQTPFTLGAEVTDDPYHVPLLRNELRRALDVNVPAIVDEIDAAFTELATPTKGRYSHVLGFDISGERPLIKDADWTSVKLKDTIMKVVCRATNRVFVELPLCRNPEWVDLNVQFTIDVLTVSTVLRATPAFLRPLINRLISRIPKDMEIALRHLRPLFEARRREKAEKGEQASPSSNLITWMLDIARGPETADERLAIRILATNFGAIHTTTMTFMHALYDLAANPRFTDVLREEVDEVLHREGWTKTAMDQMERIDSFIRESQRLSPLSNVGSQRILQQEYTFCDGTTLPAGTAIAVCIHTSHFADANYEDAQIFDPLRFVKLKATAPQRKWDVITTAPDFLSFGHGKHACPGRFFAAAELKLMLAYVVANYDVKLAEEGVRPKDFWIMGSCLPNQSANVLFRRRS